MQYSGSTGQDSQSFRMDIRQCPSRVGSVPQSSPASLPEIKRGGQLLIVSPTLDVSLIRREPFRLYITACHEVLQVESWKQDAKENSWMRNIAEIPLM